MQAATEHVRQSDADLAMLFCGQPLRGFYDKRTPADLAVAIEQIQLESLGEARLAELITELDGGRTDR